MRILLDEMMSRKLWRALADHEICAASNAMRALLPAVPRIRASIQTIQPGDVVMISALDE